RISMKDTCRFLSYPSSGPIRRSRRDTLKGAPHFSVGLPLFKKAGPDRDDRLSPPLLKSDVQPKESVSIVPDGTQRWKDPNPAIICWATFTESLRDAYVGASLGTERKAGILSSHCSGTTSGTDRPTTSYLALGNRNIGPHLG